MFMPFKINILGQVNEIKLPKYKALWPLFETIVNAIQSIEDSPNKNNGEIIIYAQREEDKIIDLSGNEVQYPFISFTVKDNGEGFNEKNYDSFLEAYSNLKVSKGCKGIGRFLWLKAFDNVHIESNFCTNNIWKKRQFNFNLQNGITPDENVSLSNTQAYCTSVFLDGFFSKHKEVVSLSLNSLAKKVIEHCLPYFLSTTCPKIILKDSDGESIILNNYYETNIKNTLHQDKIVIKEKDFSLYHICMFEGADKHELHFCANNREVKSFDLSKEIPDLQKKILSGEKSFYYVGYLTGSYLDEAVNTNRTAFDFDEVESLFDVISTQELLNSAYEHIKTYLADDLVQIKNEKVAKIDSFIKSKKPQYKYLINNNPAIYEKIPAGLTEEKLELELYKHTQKWEFDILQKGKEIDKRIKDNVYNTAEYMTLFNDYCSSLSEISRISLSEYVIRRKAIIELLDKTLEINDDGKYNSEASVHSIICPMRITSDEINFEEMNLWLIDDRLAYHDFLASDKPMKSLPVLESNIDKRMDIAIFDSALSFSSDKETINSITIIELKKPQRNDLNAEDKDPIKQVLNYVSDIKSGKVKKANGRDFGPVNNTAFYCYVIADLTDTLKNDAETAGLVMTPDKMGYFGYNQPRGAYIEVISYDKLIKDAKQRNQILFDKLFEPKVNQVISKPE